MEGTFDGDELKVWGRPWSKERGRRRRTLGDDEAVGAAADRGDVDDLGGGGDREAGEAEREGGQPSHPQGHDEGLHHRLPEGGDRPGAECAEDPRPRGEEEEEEEEGLCGSEAWGEEGRASFRESAVLRFPPRGRGSRVSLAPLSFGDPTKPKQTQGDPDP